MSRSRSRMDRKVNSVEKREMAQLRAELLAEHQGLNESNDIIAAERYEDIERLRVYAKLLKKPGAEDTDAAIFNTNVLNKTTQLMRRLGYTNIAQFLTKDMVSSMYTVNTAIAKVYTENPPMIFPDASDDVMALILEDISKTDRIVHIITERQCMEAREIREVLSTMAEAHDAVVSGAL